MFLSADADRPKAAVDGGFAVADSRFTYAVGKLVLWSKSLDLTKGDDVLKANAFAKLSIANPKAAPYGAAAVEAMKALGVYDAIEPKIVQGTSIAQAFQFVDTGNAELGFVALSQLNGVTAGSRWLPPQTLYTPIRQDAVLLKTGADDDDVEGLHRLPQEPTKRGRSSSATATVSSEARGAALARRILQPVGLTIELAAVTTLVLLAIGTPLAWWLARSRVWWKEAWRRSSPCRSCCRPPCSASICWSRSARTARAARWRACGARRRSPSPSAVWSSAR